MYNRYSTGKIIILVLWALVVVIIHLLPYDINDYLEVFILITAFISIQVFGEKIDEIIEAKKNNV